MPTTIEVSFGRIVIDGVEYDYDVVIYPDGRVERRLKEISKKIHGTSHKLDIEEIVNYLGNGEEVVIIGTGIYGMLGLTEDSKRLLSDLKLEYMELPTEEAVRKYLEISSRKRVLGVFHITC